MPSRSCERLYMKFVMLTSPITMPSACMSTTMPHARAARSTFIFSFVRASAHTSSSVLPCRRRIVNPTHARSSYTFSSGQAAHTVAVSPILARWSIFARRPSER